MPTPFISAERPRSEVTHVSWIGHASHPKGAEPHCTLILGVPSFYVHTLRRRTIEFGMVTHMGGACFRDQPRRVSRGLSAIVQFLVLFD